MTILSCFCIFPSIQSLSIRSVVTQDEETSPPKSIKLFVNRDDLDFEMARELDCQCKLELLAPHHFVEGTIDYPLRPAGRFQNISSLTIFVAGNYSGEEEPSSTIITFVGLKGKGSRQKRMAVETVYESRGMKKDHEVRGEFGNQQFL
jgi:hypothetical protein